MDTKEQFASQQIRPGLTLHWGDGAILPDRVDAGERSAVFAYSISANDSRMAVINSAALGETALVPGAAEFHAAVVVSAAVLEEILGGDRSSGAARVRIILSGEDATLLELPLTPGARLAVESIRRCPFVGACRGMALAARCNDLLVEFVTALASYETPRAPALTRGVHDRIRAAAENLRRDLETPPSLATLARQAGLSETSLKRGFRQIYETTVFGYLRERRMERARDLLQSGEATVLEAAALVGYSNPSNFATAFRRQFGVNPKTFQLTARRQ